MNWKIRLYYILGGLIGITILIIILPPIGIRMVPVHHASSYTIQHSKELNTFLWEYSFEPNEFMVNDTLSIEIVEAYCEKQHYRK